MGIAFPVEYHVGRGFTPLLCATAGPSILSLSRKAAMDGIYLCDLRFCGGKQEGRKTPPYDTPYTPGNTKMLCKTGECWTPFWFLFPLLSSTILSLMDIEGRKTPPHGEHLFCRGERTDRRKTLSLRSSGGLIATLTIGF
jgi:hypothetical protein